MKMMKMMGREEEEERVGLDLPSSRPPLALQKHIQMEKPQLSD